jgi:hypothetical protein
MLPVGSTGDIQQWSAASSSPLLGGAAAAWCAAERAHAPHRHLMSAQSRSSRSRIIVASVFARSTSFAMKYSPSSMKVCRSGAAPGRSHQQLRV